MGGNIFFQFRKKGRDKEKEQEIGNFASHRLFKQEKQTNENK